MTWRLPAALLLFVGAALPAARAAAGERAVWGVDAAVGYDSFTHAYSLATTDTSETVSESRAVLGWEGRSAAGGRTSWRLRLEGSVGTDLWRENLEADWRRRDARGIERARFGARLAGRQYRPGTDYSLASDQGEGRLDAAFVPWAGAGCEGQMLGWIAATRYATPSPLEQDQAEAGLGVAVRSRGATAGAWRLALKHAARSYPDSSVIDRRTWSLELDWSGRLGADGLARLYGRSERRLAREPAVRPDAWLHWLQAAGEVPAPGGDLLVEVEAEGWRYGAPSEIWADSWRAAGFCGLRRGDVLAGQWRLGLAGEAFESARGSESYVQAGVRGGFEAYGSELSGSLVLEHGRRGYGPADADESLPAWTDFTYWRLWLLADWRLSGTLTLSALGNWEPERHAESRDDVSLGFASVSLSWRR
ncbi:hypothetical protein FJ250_02495 [bacterium]|nr:hypothetical protein [bacterium]